MDHSPVILSENSEKPVAILLTWGEACNAILDGKRVTKASWSDEDSWFFLRADILHLRKPDGSYHVLMVSKADMDGTDYYVSPPLAGGGNNEKS